ncbi:MAG: response regulator [Candidatus Vogelbacteria bacterium]|nr:response regulator [Candidatus Vogelbacteria bacterium]
MIENKRNVLVVDDELGIASMAARILRKSEFAVVSEIFSQVAFINLSSGHLPDLLLTDINMPGKNGIELARKAREMCPTLPIVFMSARLHDFQSEIASIQGCLTIEKPFSEEELLEVVERALPGKWRKAKAGEEYEISMATGERRQAKLDWVTPSTLSFTSFECEPGSVVGAQFTLGHNDVVGLRLITQETR